MIEFYPQIKSAHVHLVLLSVAIFAVRGGAALVGARWPRHWLLRYGSYSIDTALLTTALMLFSMLPAALFANGWLTTKVLLLVVYVALGIAAMRQQLSSAKRWAFYLAALAVYGYMFGVARMHHPLGWFHSMLT